MALLIDLRPCGGGFVDVSEHVQSKQENEDTRHTHPEGKPVHPSYHQEKKSTQEKTDEAPLERPRRLGQLDE